MLRGLALSHGDHNDGCTAEGTLLIRVVGVQEIVTGVRCNGIACHAYGTSTGADTVAFLGRPRGFKASAYIPGQASDTPSIELHTVLLAVHDGAAAAPAAIYILHILYGSYCFCCGCCFYIS